MGFQKTSDETKEVKTGVTKESWENFKEGVLKFTCPHCGMSFGTEEELNTHVEEYCEKAKSEADTKVVEIENE